MQLRFKHHVRRKKKSCGQKKKFPHGRKWGFSFLKGIPIGWGLLFLMCGERYICQEEEDFWGVEKKEENVRGDVGAPLSVIGFLSQWSRLLLFRCKLTGNEILHIHTKKEMEKVYFLFFPFCFFIFFPLRWVTSRNARHRIRVGPKEEKRGKG